MLQIIQLLNKIIAEYFFLFLAKRLLNKPAMLNATINNPIKNPIIKNDRSKGINMLCNLLVRFLC